MKDAVDAAIGQGIDQDQADFLKAWFDADPTSHGPKIGKVIFEAVTTFHEGEAKKKQKIAEEQATAKKAEEQAISERTIQDIVTNIVSSTNATDNLNALQDAISTGPKAGDLRGKDKTIQEALRIVEEQVQKKQSELFRADKKDTQQRLKDRRVQLTDLVNRGLLTPTQAEQIIDKLVQEQRSAVASLVASVENGLPESEALARAANTHTEIRKELKTALVQKAKEKDEIKDTADKIANELVAERSMTATDIDAKIAEIRVQRPLTEAEEKALRDLVAERQHDFDFIEQSESGQTPDANMFENLKKDAKLLPPTYQNAVIDAVDAIVELNKKQDRIETDKKDLLEAEAVAKEREKTWKNIKLFMKYVLPVALGVGLGAGGIAAIAGADALPAILIGTGAGAVAGGGEFIYKWYLGGGNRENLRLRTQAEEMRMKVDKIKADASLRTLQQGYAGRELLADVLARAHGVDAAKMRQEVHRFFGTGDVKSLATRLNPQAFGFNMAA